MKTMFGQVVFATGGRKYCWEDVVLAATLCGEWADLEREVREGIACVKRMTHTEEDLPLEDVEAASARLRYARNLITAQETEAWLKEWGLTLESWMEHVRRSVLRQKWSAQLGEIASQYPVTSEEVERCVRSEGICSGHLAQWAHGLAGRAAVWEKAVEEAEGAFAECTEAELRAALEAFPPDIREYGLPGISSEASREKMKNLARLEVCFHRFQKHVLTSKAVQDQIGLHHLDWIRLECRCLSFPNEQVAREAALCVREDGHELAEVAAAAKTGVRETRFYLDEVDLALRERFLGARKGELLGPVDIGGEFGLFWVLDKIMPSEHEPDVRRRAEDAVLQRAVAIEISSKVRWHSRLEGEGLGRLSFGAR